MSIFSRQLARTALLASVSIAGLLTGQASAAVIDYADGSTSGTPIILTDNSTQLRVMTGSATQSGVISESGGSFGLEKIGAGTLTLSATNTYTGGTAINAGTLSLSGSGTLGTGAVALSNGILNAATTITAANAITFNADSAISAASGTTLNLTGNLTFNHGAGSMVTVGSATDTGVVNVSPGIVTVGATPGALVIAGGTLRDTLPGSVSNFVVTPFTTALGKLSSVTINSGASLEINSAGNGRVQVDESYIKLFGSGQLVMGGNVPRVVLGNSNFAGRISGNGYIAVGGAQNPGVTVILTGDNNSAVEFQIMNASTLQVGNGGTSGSLASGVKAVGYSGASYGGDAVLKFNRSDNLTFAGSPVGSLVLEQAGSGILTLATTFGSAGFTGSVRVSSGGLAISSTAYLNNVPIAMSAGTTLHVTTGGSYTNPVATTGNATVNVTSGAVATWTAAISNGGTLTLAGGGTLQIGDGGTAGSLNGNVINNGILAFSRSDSTTFGGVISGTGSLAKSGSGTLVLAGANTYIGGTTITNGQINFTSGDNFGTGSITLNSGGLQWASGNTVDISSRLTAIGAFGARFDTGANTIIMASALSGTGSITKTGSGTLILTAANNFAGAARSAAGTLQIGNGGTTGSIAGDASVDSGAVLAFNRSNDFTYAGVISGGGAMMKAGAGTLILTGSSSYSGGTTISGGVLQIGGGGAAGSINGNVLNNGTLTFNRSDSFNFFGIISGAGSVTKSGAGTLTLTGASTYMGDTIVDGGLLQIGSGGTTGSIAGNVVTAGGSLAFNQSGSLTYAGVIFGNGSLTKSGTGTLILTATSTYTGGSVISAGTLQVGNGGTSGGFAGNVANSGALVFNRSNDLTYAGVISGGGTVTKSGAGVLILTGANTYSGGTTIGGGTLQVGDGSAAGTITGNVANSGTLAFNRSDAVTFGGVVSGSGQLVKSGSGVLILTAANTYAGGTTISGGTLQIGDGGNIAAITGNILNNGTLAFKRGDTVFSGVISGTGSLVQLQNNTLALTGDNTYSGPTIISNGIVALGNYGSTGSVAGNIINNFGLEVRHSNDFVLSNAISGTGNVSQWGSGKLTLAGANTYTSYTSILPNTVISISADRNLGDTSSAGSFVLLNADATLEIAASGTYNSRIYAVGVSGCCQPPIVRVFPGVAVIWNGKVFGGNATLPSTTILKISGGGTFAPKSTSAAPFIGTGGLADSPGLTGGYLVTGNSTLLVDNDLQFGESTASLALGDATTSGRLQLGASMTVTRAIALGVGGGVIDTAGTNVTSGGTVSGSGGVTKAGAGTLTIAGANTYGGGTNITGGLVNFTALNNFGTGGVTLNGGGLQWAIGSTVDVSPRLAALGTGGATFDTNGNSITLASAVSGAGGAIKVGNGVLTLTGSNTYTGGTTINAGTLQIGSGGATGSITGNVANNGTLAFNRSDSFAFEGVISGSGTVAKNGAGALTLSGANTYSGGTIVAAGTLSLAHNDAAGTGAITIAGSVIDYGNGVAIANDMMLAGNMTQVQVLTGAAATQSGDISENGGSLPLEKTGGGTLFLTGTNTYTGGTTVTGGMLIIGDGGTSGAVAGNVANSGTLAFNRSDSTIFSGVVSGSGVVNQAGSGTTILTGANTYSGGTFVSGGTLVVGNGGTSGAITGNVVNNATLAFNRSDEITFSGVISGSGIVDQAGSGTTILTGANTYTGGTIVTGGILRLGVGGSVGTGPVTLIGGVFDLGSQTLNSGNLTGTGGTINLGSGGLLFNMAGNQIIGSILAGSGGIVKSGTGTLTLTGANSFTGGITVAGGTLSLVSNNAAGTGAITTTGSVIDYASGITVANPIIINSNTTQLQITTGSATQAGAISETGGARPLEKIGAGTLILTSANTYTGGTTITAGILQIGNGGTTGSISGNVANSATLAFNRSDAVTYDGVISGSGSVSKLGGTALIFTGANTYAGGTTITAGTLQIGNGGTTGSISGNVANSATLAFNRSDAATFGGVISGSGSVNKLGANILTFSGTSTYTGTTTVSGGTLAVNGAIGSSAVTVASGATLGGTGTVGSTTVQAGASLTPGSGIGTLSVNGNLTLAVNSTYSAELSPTAADRVVVSGSAALNGTLALAQGAGTYTAGTSLTLLTAGNITGTFANVTGLSFADLRSELVYSATSVVLVLSPLAVNFVGASPNQAAVAAAINAGPLGNALQMGLSNLVRANPAQMADVLDSVSGEIHASIRGAALDGSRLIRNTVQDHLATGPEGTSLWGRTFADYGALDSDGNAAETRRNNAGIIAGLDTAVADGLRLGLGGAYMEHKVGTAARGSRAVGSRGSLLAYASYESGAFSVRLGGDYGWGRDDITRTVAALGETEVSRRDGESGGFFARASYDLGLPVLPYAGIAHASAWNGGFTETGGLAALNGAATSESQSYSLLGFSLVPGVFTVSGLALTPRADIAWSHGLDVTAPDQIVSLTTGQSFTVLGTPVGTDAAALQLGLDLQLAPQALLSVGYDGLLSGQGQSHAVRGGLNWRF